MPLPHRERQWPELAPTRLKGEHDRERVDHLGRELRSPAHVGSSFPYAAQPGGGLRANSSSLEAAGYIRSISS